MSTLLSITSMKEVFQACLPIREDIHLKSLLFNTTSLVFTSTMLASFLWYRNTRQRYSVVPRWPPGPKPWPIIGNMLELKSTKDKRVLDKVEDLTKVYGSMVHLYIGMGIDVVIISGTDLINEAFVDKSDVFSNRPLHMPNLVEKSHEGIVLQHGPPWKKIKTFTMMTLKEVGFRKISLQIAIQEEAYQVCKIFQATNGRAFDVTRTLTSGVANVISSLVFNERYEHDDVYFQKVLNAIDEYFSTGGSAYLARSFMPTWILTMFSSSMRRNNAAFEFMKSFIKGMIDKHRQDFDINELRDFIDYYLKLDISNKSDRLSENDIFRLIFDLFLAGTETTSTTLNWMMVYLIRNQDIQNKCRREIHEVIGTSRLPTWKDKGTLPYTEAMILETQRLSNIVPIGVSHCTSKPVKIGGYLLPEKTVIIPNFTESMTNEKYWKDAKTFKPERWLNEDCTALKKEIPKSFLPFSNGPRSCPGENLAKMELFIFSTTILQQLKINAENDSTLPSMIGNHIATVIPKPYKAVLTTCI